jgi:hypothetical protein
LFRLTDCANPNVDFSGGIIAVNEKTADLLQIREENRVKVTGASYRVTEGSPQKTDEIAGTRGDLFPHLKRALLDAAGQSNLNVAQEFKRKNLYLEAYTCYPPIPLALLIAAGIADDIAELPKLLEQYEITITGGMNFAKAPWNNPALNGLIEMYTRLISGNRSYGLVHGNGGIGEVQGVAILEAAASAKRR